MKKTYIAPETEITKTPFDSLLVNASQTEVEGPGGDNGQGEEVQVSIIRQLRQTLTHLLLPASTTTGCGTRWRMISKN